jgi:xanthine dehydrogenase accessory factor
MNIFDKIIEVKNSNKPAMLATVVEVTGSGPGNPGDRILIQKDGMLFGTIGGGAIEKKIIDEAQSLFDKSETSLHKYCLEDIGMACGGSMTIFLEHLMRTPSLVIFGAGHIGSHLCQLGKLLGFTVTIVDNRPEFACKEKLPWADKIIAEDYKRSFDELELSENTYAVILTHRHIHDYEILFHCAGNPFRYLGMIGSKSKVAKAFQQLRDFGISETVIEQIHSPIGLNIGANTPTEISMSIAAELVAIRSGTQVPGMNDISLIS